MTVSRRGPRRTRVVAILATGALVASTGGALAAPFDDVSDSSPHAAAIAELAEREIMQGRADGGFHPRATLTRAQLATVVARGAGLDPVDDAEPFPDVSGPPHAGYIAAAADAGLVTGFDDGLFRPQAPIRRDQMAVVLDRWLEPEDVEEDAFTDLGSTEHAAAINALAAIDVARGFEDGTFRPRSSLQRDQAASFVWRAVEHVEQREHPWDAAAEDVWTASYPDGGIQQRGVDYHGRIERSGASAVNPVQYDDGEALVTTGRFGMRIYDIRDRFEPKLIGELPRAELALPGDDPAVNYHTAESLNIDKDRDIAFLSRDPRAFGNDQATGVTGVYLIDIADPTAPELITFHELRAGHTATCVNDCQYLWSGGPSRAADDPEDWIARPIFVTDVTDPENPSTFEEPVDTGRWRGVTDYAHDVQVDQQGVAWVAGRGGMRGYWTEGERLDPTTGQVREATAWDPVPYKGGEVGTYTLNGAIHNSERPVDGPAGEQEWADSERPRRPDANDGAVLDDGDPETRTWDEGELIYVTDENFTQPCSASGKFYINSLAGSDQGQAWRDAATVEEEGPYELEEIGVWSVFDKEATDSRVPCSAHYFQMENGIVAGGWYSQGFRMLDVKDPSEPFQIGYFRANTGSAWSTHWVGDVIYANDINHGIMILTLDPEGERNSATRTEVLAPEMTGEAKQAALAANADLVADDTFGWSCALPAATASFDD